MENMMDKSDSFRSGFVSLIGRPNVGKSTLMNQIIGQKIAITSSKPQTTRNRIQTVYTCDQGQIVFTDTPGMHRARTKLGEYMESAAEGAVRDVDAVLWLVEPDSFIGPGDRKIAEKLGSVTCPVLLVINKTDKVEPAALLKVIDLYKSLHDFEEIIPVSALTGDGVQDLISTILKYLPYGPMYYDEDTVTDQPERQIVAELIREKALRCLDEEVPHGIAVSVEQMKKRPGKKIIDIDASIVCEKSSHKGIIIGKQGAMLRKIGSYARSDMEEMLGIKVNLKLWVKVRKDWRDSDMMIRNFGYDKREI